MAAGHRSPALPVLLFSAVCVAATWFALQLAGQAFTWPYAVILGWFSLVSLFLLSWQERAWGPDVRPFIRRFMGGLVIKLLASLVLFFILIKVVQDTPAAPLATAFALLYLAFLGFSTTWLVGRMRNLPKP